MIQQLYTPADVAEVCSISRRKVYSLIENGELPAVKIGFSSRVKESDLEAYVERQEQAEKEQLQMRQAGKR